MVILFLVLLVTVLLILSGGLVFNVSLHKRGGLHRMRQNYDKILNARLHKIIFLQD
jgi:hypothetical protein